MSAPGIVVLVTLYFGVSVICIYSMLTFQLWDLSLTSAKERACRVANRNLSRSEWDQFIGAGRSYRRTCAAFPPGEGAPVDAPATG